MTEPDQTSTPRRSALRTGNLLSLLVVFGAIFAASAIIGCGDDDSGEGNADAGSTTTTAVDAGPTATPINVKKLPVGTGKFEESGPKQGPVYSCITNFTGSGPFSEGPWFSDDISTYNLNEKIQVEGEVEWDSEFKDKVSG